MTVNAVGTETFTSIRKEPYNTFKDNKVKTTAIKRNCLLLYVNVNRQNRVTKGIALKPLSKL